MLLFLPGLIASYALERLTSGGLRDRFFFIMRAMFFAFASYLLYGASVNLAVWMRIQPGPARVAFLDALAGGDAPLNFVEIAVACIIGLLLGMFATLSTNRYWHYSAARLLRLTNLTGPDSVWKHMLDEESVVWITVRDYRHNRSYVGWVEKFCDDANAKELLLRAVTVFKNDTAEKLYTTDAVYLSGNFDEIVINYDMPSKTGADHHVATDSNAG